MRMINRSSVRIASDRRAEESTFEPALREDGKGWVGGIGLLSGVPDILSHFGL